jgi:CBS domain-containing protein
MKLSSLKVSDLMTTSLVILRERDTLNQADLDMRLARIRHIPVTDEGGHVVGILSSRDLARASRRGVAVPVASVMTREVRTIGTEAPAHQAAELMLSLRIGSLPVVGEDEQLVGIVTETDFLRIACQALGGTPG